MCLKMTKTHSCQLTVTWGIPEMTQHITQEGATHIAAECMLYEELDKEQYQLALEKFASIIAAAEREACASLCDEWNTTMMDKIAAAIRARKNKEATEN